MIVTREHAHDLWARVHDRHDSSSASVVRDDAIICVFVFAMVAKAQARRTTRRPRTPVLLKWVVCEDENWHRLSGVRCTSTSQLVTQPPNLLRVEADWDSAASRIEVYKADQRRASDGRKDIEHERTARVLTQPSRRRPRERERLRCIVIHQFSAADERTRHELQLLDYVVRRHVSRWLESLGVVISEDGRVRYSAGGQLVGQSVPSLKLCGIQLLAVDLVTHQYS